MGENEERRQAHRQKRGLLRQEEILRAAGMLFVEVGYDNATTGMIAVRAGVSSGSLYQFFPNKEAIAQAYAGDAVAQLHDAYDRVLLPEVISLPLKAYVDVFVDAIVAVNRAYPGYLALVVGSTISSSLALALADLQQGTLARLDAVFAARWPQSTHEQRSLPLMISYRLFLALLPLVLHGDAAQQETIVQEMKVVFYRYWEPILGD